MTLGTNVNSTSVHRDCVEDADILLSDICFNEDFYSKPPTVEFTVIDEVTGTLTDRASSIIDDSTASLRAHRSSTSTSNVNNNSTNSSSSSSSSSSNMQSSNANRNISTSSSSVLNIAAQRSNTAPPSSSSSSAPSSSLSAASVSATAAASGSRVKATRMPPAELSLKVAYSSGVEIPLDYSLGQEISIYTSGRNRKVYYGLNGAPYYITDTGTVNTYVLIVRDFFLIAVQRYDVVTNKPSISESVCKDDTIDDYSIQHSFAVYCTVLYCTVLYWTVLY